MNCVLLSHDETMELIASAQQGNEDALSALIEHNGALVRSLARKFLGRGTEFDDLYQIGCVGLVKAVKNYSMEYNVRFSTYAVPMIMGEIKRFLRDDGAIKVSRALKETAFRAMHAKEAFKDKHGREATIRELADELNISSEDLIFALDASKAPISLFEKAYDYENSKMLLIDKVVAQDDMVDKIVLRDLLNRLEVKERQIIMLRYFQDKTQTEIAAIMGISQVQVSRLENRILEKLRKAAM